MVIILSVILAAYILLILLFYLGFYTAALYTAYAIMIFAVIILIFWLQQAYFIMLLGNAPYVRTSRKVISKVLTEVKIKPGSVVYELGCGDARFLRQLVKKTNVQAVGYEYLLPPYVLARLLAFPQKNIRIIFNDFLKADLTRADFIFCFLMPKQMDRLEKKLRQELKPGALVVSNTFKFKNWQLEKEIYINPRKNYNLSNKIYIYRR